MNLESIRDFCEQTDKELEGIQEDMLRRFTAGWPFSPGLFASYSVLRSELNNVQATIEMIQQVKTEEAKRRGGN